MFEVTIPDPSQQYLKTPVEDLVEKQVEGVDENGELITYIVTEKKLRTVTGENGEQRIVMLSEANDIPLAEKHSKARWGLGCPSGDGWFCELKPTSDLSGFEPVDPSLKMRLGWTENPDGSVSFTCSKCGAVIRLVRA